MMHLSIDFGASTIDVVRFLDHQIQEMRSFESSEYCTSDLASFLQDADIDLSNIDSIFVTGGRSRTFINELDGIPVHRINEIEAIGKGGWYLLNTYFGREYKGRPQPALVVSMGTGTCMVYVSEKKGRLFWRHVGGTGVGGGTFLGLAREILGETRIEKILQRFERGNPCHVDISVEEIVGGGIGIVSGKTTASNLGKIAGLHKEIHFTKDDLAAGIVNLIGQTIATAAVFAAQASRVKTVLLTGKLTKIAGILEVIFRTADIYSMEVKVPNHAEFVSAIGAGL